MTRWRGVGRICPDNNRRQRRFGVRLMARALVVEIVLRLCRLGIFIIRRGFDQGRLSEGFSLVIIGVTLCDGSTVVRRDIRSVRIRVRVEIVG